MYDKQDASAIHADDILFEVEYDFHYSIIQTTLRSAIDIKNLIFETACTFFNAL